MNRKTGSLLGLVLVMTVGVRADDTIVCWGQPNGDTNVATVPLNLATVPTTYKPGNVSNPPLGKGYYEIASGRSPVFNATANDSPVARIPMEFPGQAGQINIGTSRTNFQQMVVWESFLTNHTTVTSLALKLFPYGPGFTNGTYRFLLLKNSGEWYASTPVELTKATYTPVEPVDPTSLTWHEFTPLTNGVGSIGASAPIDLTGIKTVGYYSSINGSGQYIGTYTAYFSATGIPSRRTASNKQEE